MSLALACFLASAAAGPVTAQSEPLRPWTVLVYGGADNNADGPILEFLDGVRKAIDDDPGIELLLLLDRSEGFSDDATLLGADFHGARLYRLKRDSAERLSGGEHFPEITLDGEDAELDSADADNVRRFIEWGQATAPAQRYGLMIYSHADGQTMCPDEESGRDMGIPELSEVLREKHSLFNAFRHAGAETATHVSPAYGYSDYYGYRAGLYNIPFVGFGEQEETVHYKVGTANIDVVDARKKQLIWVAVAEGRLTDAMMNSPDDSIAKIVSDMFAKYPAKAPAQ
jgi:hypothetical protein